MKLSLMMSVSAALTLLAVSTGCASKKEPQSAAPVSSSTPSTVTESVPEEALSLEEKIDSLEEAVLDPATEAETFTSQVALLAASAEVRAADPRSRQRVDRLVAVAERMQTLSEVETIADTGVAENLLEHGAFASSGDEAAAVSYTLGLGEVSHE